MGRLETWLRAPLRSTGAFLAALAAAGVIFSGLILAFGRNPLETYGALFGLTFGSAYGWSELLVKMIPLLLTALATALPARLGLVNVGGEGQLAFGALAAAPVALALGPSLPGWLAVPAVLIAGFAGGAFWAVIPAWLRARGWLNETISTLLLNYVALNWVSFFVFGLLRDPASANVPQTAAFGVTLPVLFGRVHAGLFLALGALALVAWALERTRWGYEIRVIGANPLAARRHGLEITGSILLVMALAGGLAGWAGTAETLAIQGRLRPGFSPDYGYLGFLISWLAGHKPLRLLFMTFLVAAVTVGGDSLQIQQGLPFATVNVFMALILMFVLAKAFDAWFAPKEAVHGN